MKDARRSEAAPPRPRRVLVAGVVAAGACALLVVTLFDALGRMRSAAVRDSVAESLAKHNDFGLGVGQLLGVMRGVTYVSGALAAAGVVLAVYTLQRHRGARIGLSVVAVMLVFTATLVAGLLPLLLGVAVLRLWSRDARDWFAGRPARPPQAPSSPPPPAADPWAPSQVPPVERAGTEQPPPSSRPPASPYAFGTEPVTAPVPDRSSAPPQDGPVASIRPGGVRVACWLTWVLSGLLALFLLLLAAVLTADSGALLSQLRSNPRLAALNLSDREWLSTLWVLAAVGISWALAAMALAVLAFRRVDAGRIGLVVSAVLAAVVGAVVFPVGLIHAAAAVTATVLLLRRPAQDWYAGRPTAAAPRLPPPPGPPRDKPPVW